VGVKEVLIMAENINKQINQEAEYCYCHNCRKLREISDLIFTDQGLQCRYCGGHDFDEAGWVVCPHHKISAVKCPRAGKGIIDGENGLECTDRCFFRFK
jgi:hypothetical protein